MPIFFGAFLYYLPVIVLFVGGGAVCITFIGLVDKQYFTRKQ